MTKLVSSEEQELLRSTAADFVARNLPVGRVRRLRDSGDPLGFSLEQWKSMAALGWPGITLPEEHGGLGLGLADLAVVLEELGTVLAPEPFVGTVLLGAGALLLGGSAAQKSSLLPRVAAGETFIALAHHEPGARHRLHYIATRAEPTPSGGFRLTGDKDLVLDGMVADTLIVVARTAGDRQDREGLTLLSVDTATPGVSRARQQLVDGRVAATVHFAGVEVPASAAVGTAGAGAALLDQVIDRALVGLAAEMLGGMRRAQDMTMAYLKDREQFGAKIGSFQALKHRAARMFIEVELGRSVVMAAARALDADAKDASRLASLAKARLSDSFVLVANEALQMHGGIGMTDEHDVGLYLKRARAAELTLGDAAFHRDRYAALEGY